MNDLLKLAIAKKLEKDTKNFKPVPGVHNIDETITVHVTGTLTKLADVEYTPTVDIPLIPTLALVLEKAGFQRERAKTLLIEAMTEALLFDQKGSDYVADRVKDIEAATAHVREITDALPKKVKSGATKVELDLDIA